MVDSKFSYLNVIHGLFLSVFNVTREQLAEQDQAWNKWVNFFDCRKSGDLCNFLKEDVRDVFKARAITILLIPDMKILPFLFSKEDEKTDRSWCFAISDLSKELQEFTMLLLKENINFVLRSEHNKDILGKLLYLYNGYIVDALELLPEDSSQAAEMFDYYQIGPVPNETHHCYTPLFQIIVSEAPEKWKKLVDTRVRELIYRELEAKNPPEAWKTICWGYVENMGWAIERIDYGETFRYSRELLASQVGFVLSLPEKASRSIDSRMLRNLMRLLKAKKYKNTRYKLACHLIPGTDKIGQSFSVYDSKTRALAVQLLSEFGDSDKELGKKLRDIIAKGDEYIKKEKGRKKAELEEREEVMASMK